MRHRIAGKQLSRTPSHRVALRRNLAASLIEHGAIRTTETKAKELRRFIERLITIAKAGTLHARRLVVARLQNRRIADEDTPPRQWQRVVTKLFDEIAPRYADRPGGYTRIIRLSERRIGDAGNQVLLQLVEEAGAKTAEAAAGPSRRKRRAAKRHQAATEVPTPPPAEAAEPAAESAEPAAEAEQQQAPETEEGTEPEKSS